MVEPTLGTCSPREDSLGEGGPTSRPGCPPPRGASGLAEISLPQRDPSQEVAGEGAMGDSLASCHPEDTRPPVSLPLTALLPPMDQSGSELGCAGTLGISWVQGGVASPRGLLPTEVVSGWKV